MKLYVGSIKHAISNQIVLHKSLHILPIKILTMLWYTNAGAFKNSKMYVPASAISGDRANTLNNLPRSWPRDVNIYTHKQTADYRKRANGCYYRNHMLSS